MTKKNQTGIVSDLDVNAAISRVRVAHEALTKARNKVARCKKPESRDAAGMAMVAAEDAYRVEAAERDRLVTKRNAQLADADEQERKEIDADPVMVKHRRKILIGVCLPCSVSVYVECETEEGEEPDEHSDWTFKDVDSASVEVTARELGEHMTEDDFEYANKQAAIAAEEES